MSPKDFVFTYGERLASDYAALPTLSFDSAVDDAYCALRTELIGQWHSLPFEPTPVDDNPYGHSADMFEDIQVNGRLLFLRTAAGSLHRHHPLAMGNCGTGLLYNDLFRAVHDYYGHYSGRNTFSAVGEEKAFRLHARMFSPLAVKALATETRGQNSWFNFGPHKNLPPNQRPYAEQKAGLLPAYAWEVF